MQLGIILFRLNQFYLSSVMFIRIKQKHLGVYSCTIIATDFRLLFMAAFKQLVVSTSNRTTDVL